jgi:hypothetical protein
MKPGMRMALQAAIGVIVLLVAFGITLKLSARKAYARADAFCAAAPPGTPARDVTIHALDQSVQVRTDLEPGALVVRFEAWGPSDGVGDCHMTVVDNYVSAARVVHAGD